ncbi:acrosomal protein KIAA1210 homolog [Spea bombifrons]|uniref:acrosomal protein KIAA1210 homolog n=1 Tax=Spea bombifrons TaxID=233779 RepID=UPI0023496045|nr:acrosomal protein KIAA1210 homolog [Spea bombifrons]
MSALYGCLKGKNDTLMAANSTDVPETSEMEEVQEECTGKKKSKFQAFKKLFVKKKRKESPAPSRESTLKPSQSSSDVSASAADTTAFHPAHEPGTKGSMGNKALSHDSVFISESENVTEERSSQEKVPGKVKALQLQQNIRIGSAPQGIISKRLEDTGALSEDDGLPRSPPEINLLHDILGQSSSKPSDCAQRRSSLSLGGTDSEEEPVSSAASSRPISPFRGVLACPTSPAGYLTPVDFTTPASTLNCLDNSAAKHRIAIKPKKHRGHAFKRQQQMQQLKEDSVTGSGKDDAEAEIHFEQKFTEDLRVKMSLDGNLQPLDVPEKSKDDIEGSHIPVVSESFVSEDERVSSEGEAASCKTDLNIYSNLVADIDQMEHLIQANEEEVANTQSTCDASVLSVSEQLESLVEHSEFSDVKTEPTDSDIIHNLQCRLDSPSNVTDETVTDKSKDEELNGQDGMAASLPEKVDELPLTTERTLIVTEPSLLETDMSEMNISTIICDSDKAADEQTSKRCDTYETDRILLTPNKVKREEIHLSEVDRQKSDDNPSEDDQLSVLQLEADQGQEELGVVASLKEKVKHTLNELVIERDTVDSSSVPSVSMTNDAEENMSRTNPSTEICEEIKTELHAESKEKTATKPVRFTVAPAWQRSLSGGCLKDATSFKNVVKSESFDGADPPLVTGSQDKSKMSENLHEITKTSDEGSSVPFGVRLRSTPTPLKYNEEQFVESGKQAPVAAVPLAHNQNVSNPVKTSPFCSDSTKLPKLSPASEDRLPVKAKNEDPQQRESSEPAWISMAKQKRKGFQDHPLARDQNVVAEKDKNSAESSLKKSLVTDSHTPEGKWRTEIASVESPEASIETRPEPEKSVCHIPTQNPDEPPWLSLAKKKAKAWSEMPQIAQ